MAPIDYAAANAAARRFKSALTRATNKKDWKAVIKVADDFAAYFDSRDWARPDNWALWANAKDDAEFELRRASTRW